MAGLKSEPEWGQGCGAQGLQVFSKAQRELDFVFFFFLYWELDSVLVLEAGAYAAEAISPAGPGLWNSRI